MVTLNQEKQKLTLKACFKGNNINELVVQKDGKTTLISEDATVYAYFDQEKLDWKKIKTFFTDFVKTNTYDINIDIDSFTQCECSIKVALETLLYWTHKPLSYKTKNENDEGIKFNILSTNKNVEQILSEALITSFHINATRDLQDAAPNFMYPDSFAKEIQSLAKDVNNVKVTVLDKSEIEKLQMGLLLSVNAGSHHEARVVIVEYNGDKETSEKVGLIGKGITFDTGGYSLKPSNSMCEGMKFDMSGAAIVCNSVLALAKLNAKVNVVAVACLTENRIGGHATLVESVITSMNGKTVEITNTDAEGRLVLADGMTYAIRKLNATKLIEVSTLTGAVLWILGQHTTAVFANNDEFYGEFKQASINACEEVWRLPIHQQNYEYMKNSKVADLQNSESTRNGGSSNAAAFLNEFAEEKPFIHLDICGTSGMLTKEKRGTGVMLKTLVGMLKKQ